MNPNKKYQLLHTSINLNFNFYQQKEPNLRATQYLPDVVYLQQCLYDIFNLCVDRNTATNTTIREFISTLTNGDSYNSHH